MAQLQEHLRIPMFSNAYVLIVNQIGAAGLGMLYWMLATRFFSTEVVGQSSAIISTIIFLAALSELSLKSGMTRFVPRSGKQTPRLVIYTYGVNLICAAVISSIFFYLGDSFQFTATLFEGTTLKAGWAILGTMAWTIYIVEDGVLNGMRRSIWVLFDNMFFSAAKIILLVVSVWLLHSYGIVGSWFIPVPFVILFANTLIFRRFMPVHIANANPHAAPVTRQQIFTSVSGDHIGSLLAETCVRLLPLMVVNLVSKSANAYFSQAWLVATVVYLIATNMATSFTVEAATNMKKAAIYSRQMLKQMALLIVPLAVLIGIAAPLVLSLFGTDYARQGTTLLRLLAIAALPIILNNWYLSYVRVLGDVKAILLNQGLLCVLMLGLSYWWLPTYGIIAIGMAWLVAQSLIAVIVISRTAPMLLRRNEPEEETRAVSRNQILRRSDWRFLTPTPQPKQSLCLATGDLAMSVARISGEVARNPSSPQQDCDLAVAVNPDLPALRLAYKALLADGTCYTEWAAWRKGGAWGIHRRLRAAGFSKVKLYWPFPSTVTPRFWLPLHAGLGPYLYLTNQLLPGNGLIYRMARLALAKTLMLVIRLGFMPYLGAVAHKNGSHSPETIDLIAAEWLRLHAGSASGEMSYLMQTGGTRVINKVVFLVFNSSHSQPAWVIKMTRIPEYAYVLHQELDVLKRLAVTGNGKSNGWILPRAVFSAEFNNILVTGQTALNGRAISNYLQENRFHQTALRLTNWQVGLAQRTQTRPRDMSSQQVIEHLADQLETLADGALTPTQIAHTRQILTQVYYVPLVCAHNDFAVWNIFSSSDNLGVFDWTGADWNGLPLVDLVFAIYTMILKHKDFSDVPQMVASYQNLLDPRSHQGGIFRECLGLYAENVGLQMAHIAPLRLLTWIQHRISERRLHSLSHDGQQRSNQLDQSWSIALWSTELAWQQNSMSGITGPRG